MPVRKTAFRTLTVCSALAAAAMGVVALFDSPARGGPTPPDDGAPPGMMAYFATGTACPAGWDPATQVEGRLVVGVVDPIAIGVTVGAPLGDREDRAHTHAYTGSMDLPAGALSSADGANRQGAGAGSYTVAGTTDPGPSGAPLVQMLACVKR